MAGRIYNKLNTFLKKQLDADTYERLRHKDACIICSEKEDKAFKFVVLSDEWIYLTENPPSTISKEVHLKDITSVRLIDKKPDFLQGHERESCQHIEIIHEVVKEQVGKPSKSRSTVNTSKGDGSATSRSAPGDLRTSRSDTALLYNSDPAGKRHVHFGAGRNGRRKNSLETQSLNDFSTTKEKRAKAKKNSKRSKNAAKQSSIEEEPGTGFYLPEEEDEVAVDDELEDEPTVLDSDALESARSTSSFRSFFKLKKSIHNEELLQKSTPVYIGGDILFVEQKDEGAAERVVPKETKVLNVYILDGWSPFLRYVQFAKQNYIIDSTMLQDSTKRETMAEESNTKTPRSLTSEKYEFLYNQLRTELLNPTNTMMDNFHLIREVKNAAEKIFFIKKLFWKTTEVFDFLMGEIARYVPVSTSQTLDLEIAERAKRADELEYATLLLETLQIMMRGTEIVHSRMKTLCRGGFTKINFLLATITTLPEIPGDYHDNFFKLNLREITGGSVRKNQFTATARNGQLLELVEQYIEVGMSLLFEIFILASEGSDKYADFTTEWCAKQLELRDTTGDLEVTPFLDLLVNHLLRTFAPSFDDPPDLSAAEHVQLYFHLTVLCFIVKGSDCLLKHIKEHFYEEFKYYMSPFLVKKRLCPSVALHKELLKQFGTLVSMILEKKVKFQ